MKRLLLASLNYSASLMTGVFMMHWIEHEQWFRVVGNLLLAGYFFAAATDVLIGNKLR